MTKIGGASKEKGQVCKQEKEDWGSCRAGDVSEEFRKFRVCNERFLLYRYQWTKLGGRQPL